MKIMHLSDLHLGKRLNEFSLIPDQEDILSKIAAIAAEEAPDAVVIAGDIYDKAMPPAEAVALFDEFLVRLSECTAHIFVISGNHDSPERIAFGAKLMSRAGIHLSPVYDGNVEPVRLKDAYGGVNFYLLPFIKPMHVRRIFPEENADTYTDAIRVAVQKMHIDTLGRNILVTHQFVTGANRSESEEISVGGADNVDADVFSCFDYVALGHIHSAQSCGEKNIRYCGTPLKYSFSEAGDCKSVTIVQMYEKGNLQIRTIPLVPLHDMVELRGEFEDLTDRQFYSGLSYLTDYVHITLTDEQDIPDAQGKLRMIYRNLMKLDYDNTRTRMTAEIEAPSQRLKSPLEMFAEFYTMQNNQAMSQQQIVYLQELLEKEQEE